MKSSKLLLSFVMTLLLLSTYSTHSFAKGLDSDSPPTVPAGYEIIKKYDNSTNTFNLFKKPDFRIVDLSIKEEDSATTKVVSQRTYPIQDLRNILTNETITQYATDFEIVGSVPNSNSKNDTDKSGKVHTFLTVFYYEYSDGGMYIGMDKVSWRIEHKDDNIRAILARKYLFQDGPTLNGSGKFQNKEIPEFGSTDPKDVPKILSGTILVRDWNWAPVLRGGLATRVGIVVEHTIASKNNIFEKWSWKFGVLEEGTYPKWPD
ncbi:hypothetical protein M5X00_02295 [Paenibacillus alvei]|uniref:Uncharacterized protein n=2 Tax=Paenibacillus alvei TaxID=44250 RepID=A0ABT4GR80_PAEAL|nr:hypothetical protein [Paenibacillus alvei]MCY9539832.1 hypothetical protein [Paenibacillus alvei]MCY9703353.1 hypothetical protein [Paenibacillus alvei]MCY9735429.1 hypothetical protein [Paenibacillus alvei]MCY9753093.1 hypothetical protein [Paenibacillus alvei]MCY9759184.1 hypothetical protein [Paenibacillus alvei]